jgi:hypothetical protein
MSDGLGRGFSRDVEAILGVVTLGAQLQETYLYPHEVRENLRLAGMRLDNRLPELREPWAPLPPDYEPDFGEPVEIDEEIEEDDDA